MIILPASRPGLGLPADPWRAARPVPAPALLPNISPPPSMQQNVANYLQQHELGQTIGHILLVLLVAPVELASPRRLLRVPILLDEGSFGLGLRLPRAISRMPGKEGLG